jgi:hypothetical protein
MNDASNELLHQSGPSVNIVHIIDHFYCKLIIIINIIILVTMVFTYTVPVSIQSINPQS